MQEEDAEEDELGEDEDVEVEGQAQEDMEI